MSKPRLTAQDMRLRIKAAGLAALLRDSQPFREFVFDIFRDAGLFFPTYRRGSPHDTSYEEGRRALGLEVLHILKAVEPAILSVIEREGNLLAEKQPKQQTPQEADELEDQP